MSLASGIDRLKRKCADQGEAVQIFVVGMDEPLPDQERAVIVRSAVPQPDLLPAHLERDHDNSQSPLGNRNQARNVHPAPLPRRHARAGFRMLVHNMVHPLWTGFWQS